MSAITSQMNYNLMPTSVRCSRNRRVITSIGNSSVSGYAVDGSQTISWYLPMSQPSTFMDPKSASLKFQLSGTGQFTAAKAALAVTATPDYGAWCWIRRIEIYSGNGQLLESIDHYNTLQNMLADCFYSQSDHQGLSTDYGTNEGDQAQNVYTLARTGTKNVTNVTAFTAATVGTSAFGTFSIPLTTGFFNLAEKLFPCYAVGSDIRVDIIVDFTANAFVLDENDSTGWQWLIVNPEIHIDYITVEDQSAMAQIASTYQNNQIVIQSTTFHNYELTIPTSTSGAAQYIIPSKVMSAKYYLACFRQLGVMSNVLYPTNSVFSNPFYGNASSFQLSLGGVLYPQQQLLTRIDGDVADYHEQLQNCFHAQGALLCNGTTTRTGYKSTNAAINAANTLGTGADIPAYRAFILAASLDVLRGQSNTMLSGVNLSGITSYANFYFATATTAIYTVEQYINHDILFIINPDSTVVSKY